MRPVACTMLCWSSTQLERTAKVSAGAFGILSAAATPCASVPFPGCTKTSAGAVSQFSAGRARRCCAVVRAPAALVRMGPVLADRARPGAAATALKHRVRPRCWESVGPGGSGGYADHRQKLLLVAVRTCVTIS
eukprot:1106732-Pyramimonas_sp.AAC.1